MGKSVSKPVRLTQEELRTLCEDAVDKGVAKYISEQSEREKKKRSGLLYRTKKLLENYTKLKDYAEKAVCTIEDAEAVDETIVNTEVLEGFHIFDDDRTLHNKLRSINAVKFMLAHVDRMLEVYKNNCLSSSSEIIQRRWKVIELMYLEKDEKLNTKQIAEKYGMEISAIQKDAKEARNDLSVLFFGLDAMVLYDFYQ